jgi:hypothetical protein
VISCDDIDQGVQVSDRLAVYSKAVSLGHIVFLYEYGCIRVQKLDLGNEDSHIPDIFESKGKQISVFLIEEIFTVIDNRP